MEKNIAVIWGDCSSPEIVKQTIRVLDKVAEKYGHTFHYTDAAMGGEAIDKYGDPLPQHELDKCLAADSVLLGAVGGPKWEGLPGEQRPEKGLLRLRAGMGLYSNNRPAKIWPQLAPASPLKPEIVAQGIDFIIVRELIGSGAFFGMEIIPEDFHVTIIGLAPGAFFVLACLTALQNKFKAPSATNGSVPQSTLACGGNCAACSGSACSSNHSVLEEKKAEELKKAEEAKKAAAAAALAKKQAAEAAKAAAEAEKKDE